MKHFILKVFRGSPSSQYFEEFDLPYNQSTNIISALMMIQKNPVNRKGEKVAPISFEMGCLEEVCGACSMLLNGRPRQVCTALISSIIEESNSSIITIAPLTKFPLVRDLMVDRSSMFDSLKENMAYVDSPDSRELKNQPLAIMGSKEQEILYNLSLCMTCGVCLEACPQINEDSKFIGAATISLVRKFNMTPEAKNLKKERVEKMMQEEGIVSCANAQNCVKVCPKNIALTESLAEIYKDTLKLGVKKIFKRDNNK